MQADLQYTIVRTRIAERQVEAARERLAVDARRSRPVAGSFGADLRRRAFAAVAVTAARLAGEPRPDCGETAAEAR